MVREPIAVQDVVRYSTLFALIILLGACASTQTAHAEKLDTRLAALANCVAQYDAAAQCERAPTSLMRFDKAGRVQVDVSYSCTDTAPLDAVRRVGLLVATKVHIPPTCVIEGWIAPDALRALAGLNVVSRVALPSYAEYQR